MWMPVARAFWARRTIASSTFLPSRIIRSASSSMMITMYGIRSSGIGPGLVVALDVAGGGAGEAAVAALHLVDGPLERGLGPFRLGDHRDEEMGQAVVRGELDPLEVHEDHPDVVRGRLAEQARDDGVDHDALARAGRAGDQQVRHLREVDRLGRAGDVPPEGERQLRLRRP